METIQENAPFPTPSNSDNDDNSTDCSKSEHGVFLNSSFVCHVCDVLSEQTDIIYPSLPDYQLHDLHSALSDFTCEQCVRDLGELLMQGFTHCIVCEHDAIHEDHLRENATQLFATYQSITSIDKRHLDSVSKLSQYLSQYRISTHFVRYDKINSNFWRVVVRVVSDQSYFASAADASKNNAYHIAVGSVWTQIMARNKENWRKLLLLLSGDVEEDPGPVSLNRKGVKLFNNGVATRIFLPNGKHFEVKNENLNVDGHSIVMENLTPHEIDEINGLVTAGSELFGQSFQGLTLVEGEQRTPLKRSTRWSDHEAYDPEKRFAIMPSKRFVNAFNTNDFDVFDTNDVNGHLAKIENFIFAPKDAFHLRFNKVHYNSMQISLEVYQRMLASVMNQTMSIGQLTRTSQLLATTQMIYLNVDAKYETCLALYFTLFEQTLTFILRNGNEANNKYSMYDFWQYMVRTQNLVPTYRIGKNEKFTNPTRMQSELKLKFDKPFWDDLIPKILVRRPFADNAVDLVNDFKNGLYSLFQETQKLEIDIHKHQLKIRVDAPDHLEDLERALMHLVEDRMYETNLYTSIERAINYAAVRCSFETLKQLVSKFSRGRIVSFYDPGMKRAFEKKSKTVVIPETDHTSEKLEFINTKLRDEKSIAQIAQQEFDAWMGFFGYRNQKQVFNNIPYIYRLALQRRGKTTPRAGEDDVAPGSSTSWASTVKDTLMLPINGIANFGTNVTQGVAEIKNLNKVLENLKDGLTTKFEGTGMLRVAKSLKDIKFDSFQGVLEATKQLVNYWFQDFVMKIGQLFGVNVEKTIDATTLLFYYLIWNGTDNESLKFLLVVDVLTQIGIVDFVFSFLHKCAKSFISMFKERAANEILFEQAIKEMQTYTNYDKNKVAESIAAVQKEDAERPQEKIEDSESWIKTLLQTFSNATPKMLGVAGTIMISMIGLKSFSSKYPNACFGERVVQAARNISFLSLGLLALPKIFSSLVQVVTAVIDYAKELIVEDHTSVYTLHKKVEAWLRKAQYSENASKTRIVNDFRATLQFFSDYGEMKELRTEILKLTNPIMISEFRDRCRTMENLFQTANSAARLVLGAREVFHIQLWSEEVGVGKTGTALEVLMQIEQTMKEQNNKMRQMMGLKEIYDSGVLGHIYPLTDHLKHNDMYFGQKMGYCDEEMVFKNPEPENVITKMTLLSGYPTISSQASLEDKGRIFQFDAIVSNTNNAYVEVDNMFKTSALLRRRHLIKVNVKSEFLTEDKKGLDENKLQAAVLKGLDRNKCQHLTFTVMKPTIKEVLNPAFENMDLNQLLKWIQAAQERHISREEQRLFARNPRLSMMRNEYVQLLNDMVYAYGGSPVDEVVTVKQVREQLARLRKFKEDKTKFTPFIHVKEGAKRDEFENQCHNRLKDIEVVIDIEEQFGEAAFDVQERTLDYVFKKVIEVNGKCFLTKCENPQYPVRGKIDFSKLEWDVDNQCVVFNGPNDPLLLHWLLVFESCFGSVDMANLIKIHTLKQQKARWADIFKSEMKNVHHSTMRATQSIKNWVIRKLMNPFMNKIIGGIALALGAVAMFFSLNMIGQLLAPQPRSYSKDNRKPLFNVPTARAYEECFDQEIEVAKKGIYRIIIKGTRKVSRGHAIGIQGSVFLVNKHVLGDFEEKTIYIYDHQVGQVSNGIKKYDITKNDIKFIPNSDAVLINIRGFRPVRTLLKHFVTEDDLCDNMQNFANGQYSFMTLEETIRPTSLEDYKDGKYRMIHSGFHYGGRTQNNVLEHKRTIRVNAGLPIQDGFSGSLGIHSNPKIPRKFIGLLLADDLAGGVYLGVVSKEQLEHSLEQFPVSSRSVTYHPELVTLRADHSLYDVFDMKDELYQSPFPNQAISDLPGFVKTPIHGVVPVDTQPALQRANDKRIPPGARHFLKVSLNKTNGIHEPYITHEEEVFAKAFLRNTYIKYVPQINTVRVYSTKEAITGVRMMGSTSINSKSSAGLPYKLEKGVRGKSPFIQYNDVQKSWVIQNRVYHDVDFYERAYAQGNLPGAFKLEFRKKELVPEKKIIEPKTRTVATGNFINQVVYDKNFKELYRLVKNVWENGGSTPFALGVDPERHWNQIAQHLKFVDNIVDFDVKAWEEKVCLRLLLLTADVKIKLIEDAYRSRKETPPEIRSIVEGLAVDYTDSYVVMEDLIYRKRNGLLSGHPGTFMENSEIHEVILAIVLFRILRRKRPEWATIPFIQQHVRSIKAADDIQIAFSQIARQLIPIEELVQGYNDLGFEVTSADKNSEIRYKHLTESQFLKHGYMERDSGFVAIPNLSIIHQLLNWMRNDTALDARTQFLINIDNAFRFLYWRGEEEYESTRAIVNAALMDHGYEWCLDYHMMGAKMKMHLLEAKQQATRFSPTEEVEDDFI